MLGKNKQKRDDDSMTMEKKRTNLRRRTIITEQNKEKSTGSFVSKQS